MALADGPVNRRPPARTASVRPTPSAEPVPAAPSPAPTGACGALIPELGDAERARDEWGIIGHSGGGGCVMPEGDLEAVRAQIAVLADRTAVSEVPLRYARGVDRRDWDLVRSCFTADAFVQGSRTTAPLDQYLDILQPAVERYPTTMHFMGNQLVELTGDIARVETYAVAFHFAGDPPGCSHPEDLVLGVRYHDTVELRAGSWKITHRQVDADWQRSAPEPDREVRPWASRRSRWRGGRPS